MALSLGMVFSFGHGVKTFWKVVERRVGGQMYDRKRCGEVWVYLAMLFFFF